jgi:hypothetical protein
MACYNFDYAMLILCQAIDFAEIEKDFTPLRKWANEVEQSGRELEAVDGRLNLSTGEDVMMATLQSVAAGSISPKEALLHIRYIRFWLNCGHLKAVKTELTHQYQFA